jgi:hypothetical protein
MDNKKYFELFLKLHKENKINLAFRKKSYSVGIDKDEVPEEEEKEFKSFLDELLGNLVIATLDNEYDKAYSEYIKILNEDFKEISDDIYLKINSSLNIINSFKSRFIHSLDNEDKEIFKSAIIKIDYMKPIENEEVEDTITFELSKQDLITMHKGIGELIEQF